MDDNFDDLLTDDSSVPFYGGVRGKDGEWIEFSHDNPLTDEQIKEIEEYYASLETEQEPYEWKPFFDFPDKPVELTEQQRERARLLYDKVCEFLETHPGERNAPMMCITQDWRIRLDYGGWNSDSDYRHTVLCVMAHDDEGYYADLEYMEQCVPFIEKELKEAADFCMENYGYIPDHHEDDKRRVTDMQMRILSILSDLVASDRDPATVLIAIDTCEADVYPVLAEWDNPEYGDIIRYFPATEFVSANREIDVNRITDIVNEILQPI